MQVKDLLIEALSRANHIQRGFAADASEITTSLQHFNSQLRKYSDVNLVTAYQKILDITPTKESTCIGAPTLKKAIRLHWINSATDLPDLTDFNPTTNPMGLVIARDIYCTDALAATAKCYHIASTTSASVTTYDWEEIAISNYCAVTPDIIVRNMQRIVAAMIKNNYGDWVEMKYVPLIKFYTDDRSLIYTTQVAGENKSNFITKSAIYSNSKELKLIYNSSMKFEKSDYLELPEAHIELLTLAVTCAILMEDVDADPTQLNNYKEQLKELEDQIISQSETTRPIYREALRPTETRLESLFSGSFIVR